MICPSGCFVAARLQDFACVRGGAAGDGDAETVVSLVRHRNLNHNDKGVTVIYARWHMFEEKREAIHAIETQVAQIV